MSQTIVDTFPLPRPTIDGSPDISPEGTGNRRSCLDSTEILCGQKTVGIQHNGSDYRLQATRLGQLILTK